MSKKEAFKPCASLASPAIHRELDSSDSSDAEVIAAQRWHLSLDSSSAQGQSSGTRPSLPKLTQGTRELFKRKGKLFFGIVAERENAIQLTSWGVLHTLGSGASLTPHE